MLDHLDSKQKKNQTKSFTSGVSGLYTVHCTVHTVYVAENNVFSSTDTFNSVLAAWNADQKDPGSNLFCVLLFNLYFKFESREKYI